jgi:hypothetical protein
MTGRSAKRARKSPADRFTLAGFETASAPSPTWIPDVEYNDIDDAVASAEKWLAQHAGGCVEVIQVRKSTGRAVLSVSADSVEKLAPIHRRRTADDLELLRQARRRSVTVNAVTVRRRWRSTRWVTAGSETGLAETIFGLLFLSIAVFATSLWITGSADFGWWMPLGLLMGGGIVGTFGWTVVKYRREIDIEFIDALAGIGRSKEVQRQRHRTRRTTWRSS